MVILLLVICLNLLSMYIIIGFVVYVLLGLYTHSSE